MAGKTGRRQIPPRFEIARPVAYLRTLVRELPQGWRDVGVDLLRRPPGVSLVVRDVIKEVRVVCDTEKCAG